jgi:hypothetical protein
VRECSTYALPDAFRPGGLGKTAGDVWAALQEGPCTARELAEATGRRPRTVWAALRRLARVVDSGTGEIVARLVESDGDQWRALPGADLDRVARVLGTAGKGKAQREAHRRERTAHRRMLRAGKESP